MKSLISIAALLGTLSILPCQAEQKKTAPETPVKKPETVDPGAKPAVQRMSLADSSKVRKPLLRGPQNADGKRKFTTATAAVTRTNKKDTIKLVALAPADGGVTLEDQPRLWWWQSEATEAGELEFVLSKLVSDRDQGQPETVLSVSFGALKAGFNAIDLSHPLINKKQLRLHEGAVYQWSVGCHNGINKDAFFVLMQRVGNPDLANQWKVEPQAVSTLNALSRSGNWYELFDAVAYRSVLDPGDEGCVELRNRLLSHVGLGSALTP